MKLRKGPKVKTAFLTGLRQMEIRKETAPTIRENDQVLIRVDVVGVCGSDVHYYTTGRIGSQVVQYPDSTGHECAGTIVQIGKDVKTLKVGDRVAIDPAMPCGKCDQCLAGRAHTCRKLRFLGCPGQAPGALSDYLVMPASSCFKIPDSMSLEQAALCEPLSIGLYAVKLSQMKDGAKVGILGSGPIGLSVLLGIKATCKSDAIYVTDLIDARLAIAKKFGATWTGVAKKENVVEVVSKNEPLGLDYVFECAGQQETIDQAIEMLKPGGTLMLIGIPEVSRVSFSIDLLRRKEIRIQNVRRQNECVGATIDLVASGKIDADAMVTHHFSLERTKEAFDLVAGYRDGVVKAMIRLSEKR
jgi:L-iditol 2-dehydrogenase